MTISNIWRIQGVKRLTTVLFLIYLLVMIIPSTGWPSSTIRNQVKVQHCFGAEKVRIELWVEMDTKLHKLPKRVNEYWQKSKGDNDIFKEMLYRDLDYCRAKNMGFIDEFGSPSNKALKFHHGLMTMELEDQFRTQKKVLQYLWLALNIIIYPLGIFLIIETVHWIVRGFTHYQK